MCHNFNNGRSNVRVRVRVYAKITNLLEIQSEVRNLEIEIEMMKKKKPALSLILPTTLEGRKLCIVCLCEGEGHGLIINSQ